MNSPNYTFPADSGKSCKNDSRLASDLHHSRPVSALKNRSGPENDVYFQGEPYRLLNKLRKTPRFPVFNGRTMKNRTRDCMKFPSGSFAAIREFLNDGNTTGKHFWSSIQTCKSIHVCPVCSTRLRAAKAAQVQRCINGWLRDGGSVSLVTLTFPHSRDDCLWNLTHRMSWARHCFARHRQLQPICEQIGFFESIKSIEFTWGTDNGWHPHNHQLWFTDKEVDAEDLKSDIYPIWARACELRGLGTPSFEHGVDVRIGETAAEYITKSGISPDKDLAKEITHSHKKLAKGERLTPMGITARLGTDPLYLSLWCEYAIATRGKHAVSRFPKLQKRYNVTTVSDSEIMAGMDTSVLKHLVHRADYKEVMSKGRLFDALEVFNNGGDSADFANFLMDLDHD